ncbi:MAG: alpha/beta hydrolase [Pseudomonadota bacterium]
MTESAEQQSVAVSGGDMVYATACGPVDAPAVCLIPGLGGVGSFFDGIVPALAKRHRVIVHDHRGTGRSTPARIDYSIAQMTNDLLHVMDAFEVLCAVLLGHSTGGAIAQTVALDAPERTNGLILSSTWAAPDPYFRALFELRLDILRALGPAAYQRAGALVLRPPDVTAADPSELIHDDAAALARLHDPVIVASRIAAILRHDRQAELGRVACPVLVTCAPDDVVTPPHMARAIASAVPNARLAMADGGGHFLPQTRPTTFLALVEPFLTTLQEHH